MVLMTPGSLMKVKIIAECSPWSILQYLWPALSDNCSWKPSFGRFTQVYLYVEKEKMYFTNKYILEWAFKNTS